MERMMMSMKVVLRLVCRRWRDDSVEGEMIAWRKLTREKGEEQDSSSWGRDHNE
jgi:hypothetical protein